MERNVCKNREMRVTAFQNRVYVVQLTWELPRHHTTSHNTTRPLRHTPHCYLVCHSEYLVAWEAWEAVEWNKGHTLKWWMWVWYRAAEAEVNRRVVGVCVYNGQDMTVIAWGVMYVSGSKERLQGLSFSGDEEERFAMAVWMLLSRCIVRLSFSSSA